MKNKTKHDTAKVILRLYSTIKLRSLSLKSASTCTLVLSISRMVRIFSEAIVAARASSILGSLSTFTIPTTFNEEIVMAPGLSTLYLVFKIANVFSALVSAFRVTESL